MVSTSQKGQKRNIPQRIPEVSIMPVLEIFLIPPDLFFTVPGIFNGGCANLNVIFTEGYRMLMICFSVCVEDSQDTQVPT